MKLAKTLTEAAYVLKGCRGFKQTAEACGSAEEFAGKFYKAPGVGVKIYLQQFALGNISPLYRWFEDKGVTDTDSMVFSVIAHAWRVHHQQLEVEVDK